MNIVSLAHRVLGETLLVVALAGVVLAIVGLVRKQEMKRTERIFGMAYAGLLDLQALLGLVEFVWLLTLGAGGLVTSLFILHPILMVLALVVVHASRAWRSSEPPTRHRAQLIAYGLSLALVLGGYLIVRL